MLIITRAFFLVALAASAYSLVAVGANRDNLYAMVLGTNRAVQQQVQQEISTFAISAPEAACAQDYNSTVENINNRTISQTNTCIENANKNMTNNNTNVNKTISTMRIHLTNVQKQLTVCLNMTDFNSIINCTTSSFNYNVYNLDQANTLAYQAQDQILLSRNQVVMVEENCIFAVTASASANLTLATNDYRKCLMNTKTMRGVALV